MWMLIVMVVACMVSHGMAIEDLSDICENHHNGDVVANPFDCQSYFVCNIVPKLRFCDHGLHFDSRLKICNWPEYADCQFNRPQAAKAEVIEDASVEYNFGWFAPKPRPSFIAIDVETGLQTDPLNKYNPKHVECRHFGAYFLPHPRSCQRYFLCAYGHLHQHYCGRGTLWNYKRAECELAADAECYEHSSTIDQQLWEEEQQQQSSEEAQQNDNDLMITDVSKTTAALPTTSTPQTPATVCFVVDIGYAQEMRTTQVMTTSTTVPVSTTAKPTTDSEPVSTTPATLATTTVTGNTYITSSPISSTSTTAASSTVTVLSTPRADILACPSNREAYLPHKRDCSKYFICIVGMPVLTSCPDGLYWNQKAEFCDTPKNVDCQMK